jgi:hypothetical protein
MNYENVFIRNVFPKVNLAINYACHACCKLNRVEHHVIWKEFKNLESRFQKTGTFFFFWDPMFAEHGGIHNTFSGSGNA